MNDPNLPDDWNRFYGRCPRCRSRVHASEPGCATCYNEREAAANRVEGLIARVGDLINASEFDEAQRLLDQAHDVTSALMEDIRELE